MKERKRRNNDMIYAKIKIKTIEKKERIRSIEKKEWKKIWITINDEREKQKT